MPAPGPALASETRNLYQRLAAITAEVQVKATGKTAQGQRTISIKDTEDAIGELTAQHGVICGFRWNARPEIIGQEGKLSLWLADITVWLVNADDPHDYRDAQLFDVGSSPSAAVSFALKRYYRALFHLADEGDETRAVGGGQERAGRPAPAAQPEPPTDVPVPTSAELGELYALAGSLPRPIPQTWVEDQLKSYPAAGVRKALLAAHEKQCGASCEHVVPQPAGASS